MQKLSLLQQWNNKQQPTQVFLNQLFEELYRKKKQHSQIQVETSTVYPGFKTIPIQKLQPKALYTQPHIPGVSLWSSPAVKTIDYYRESCPLSYPHQNGFLRAFQDAYIQHGEVKVTPDDVWLTIMLFFSNYVNDHAEELRKAFVKHEGKLELVVGTKEGEEDWEDFLQKIIDQIKTRTIPGVTEGLECNFSSTDKFAKFLSTAIIMNTFKRYFQYSRVVYVCGIQNIHMGGTLEDWQSLLKKLIQLQHFDVDGDLKRYIMKLYPVLDQFVETYKGNPHVEFWNNIYHERVPPVGPYSPKVEITGWIIRFVTLEGSLTDQLAANEIEVPIKRIEEATGEVRMLHLVGGCKGVSVEDQKVYRPHFSFAVVEKNSEKNNLKDYSK